MFVLGLTGPTGAGKSFVAECLARCGFAVLDADRISRDVVKPGMPCLSAIRDTFGEKIILPDGNLDRKLLARIVFSDAGELKKLNALVHPAVVEEIRVKLKALTQKNREFAVLDAPALYESGADHICDRVAAVLAPRALRLSRIMKRDGLSGERALERMNAQPSDEFYTEKADFIIDTSVGNQKVEDAVYAVSAACGKSCPRLFDKNRD